MGAGVVIFLWLVLAGIYGGILLVFAGLWFWGSKKRKRWLKWLAGIPAVGMATVAALTLALMAYGIIDSRNPRSVFKRAFDTTPLASVSDIQSSYWWFADTGSTYIRFKVTSEAFEKLAPARLQKKTFEEMKAQVPSEGGESPVWWDYQIRSNSICYLRHGPNPEGFSIETEYFVYDPETHVAYYHFIGID